MCSFPMQVFNLPFNGFNIYNFNCSNFLFIYCITIRCGFKSYNNYLSFKFIPTIPTVCNINLDLYDFQKSTEIVCTHNLYLSTKISNFKKNPHFNFLKSHSNNLANSKPMAVGIRHRGPKELVVGTRYRLLNMKIQFF